MNILLLNQTFYPDVAATAQHSFDLAQHLVAQGHEVRVVTSRSLYGKKGASLPGYAEESGVRIYRVGLSLFGKTSIFLRILDFGFFYLLAAIRSFFLPRADVVITLTTPPFIALLGWFLKVFKRSRHVYWVMDLYPDLPIACGVLKPRGLPARFFERINRFCLKHADRVVVLGRCMRDLVLKKGVREDRIALIGVWSDHEEIKVIPPESSSYRAAWNLHDKFVVMYSGNLGLGHDALTLCRAAERLQNHPRIRFLFVGGGKRLEELTHFVAEHKLPNVTIQTYQPREKLTDLLACGDLHLISLRENVTGIMVPSKLYGILAAARPSIFVGHPDSEIARVLVENHCGYIVPNDHDEELAQLIERLATDPDLPAMGRRGLAALGNLYDRRRGCQDWERLLLACVPPAARQPAPTDPALRTSA